MFDAARTWKRWREIARVLTEEHSTGRTTLPRALPQLGPDRGPLVAWFRSDGYPAACLDVRRVELPR